MRESIVSEHCHSCRRTRHNRKNVGEAEAEGGIGSMLCADVNDAGTRDWRMLACIARCFSS